MIITLDAMGGDNAPDAAVHGAVWAARDFGVTIQLVGDPDAIKAELAKHNHSALNLPVIPAAEVLTMDDNPAVAAKAKRNSSMAVGLRQLKSGDSDAFVSAGNSGGVLATALFELGRIKGIKRPALSTTFPTGSEHGFCVILDVGANTDVRPEYLYQFGLMGHFYAKSVMNIAAPRIGLVSIGEEPDKGSMITRDAYPMLAESELNFVGNIEGKDIVLGLADVVVTDGFTGNVFLKGAEGVASLISKTLRQETKRRPLAIIGALLMRGAFRALESQMDYREFGGGPLLGIDGTVLIAHGRSDAYAIRNAIRAAKRAVDNDMLAAIKASVKTKKAPPVETTT